MQPIVCNLTAIGPADRRRYAALRNAIRDAVLNRSELPSGYAFQLDENAIGLSQVAEWIAMERRCCPFLTLQLTASGQDPGWVLAITGPRGSKEILADAFRKD